MTRSIILLGGSPGSGKSRLGRALAEEIPHELSISTRHISVGNRVRDIGLGATSTYKNPVLNHLNSDFPDRPMDEELIRSLVEEAMHEKEEDLILLDGYPRYIRQVAPAFTIARVALREVCGMLVTTADDETTLARLTKRGRSNMAGNAHTPEIAQWRVNSHKQNFPLVLRELENRGLPVKEVNTSGSKEASTNQGLFHAATMLFLFQPEDAPRLVQD